MNSVITVLVNASYFGEYQTTEKAVIGLKEHFGPIEMATFNHFTIPYGTMYIESYIMCESDKSVQLIWVQI